MKNDFIKLGRTLPVNKNTKTDAHKDLLYRALDCSVIEYMHYQMKQTNLVKEFDTVRGIFTEGGQAFPGSGINSKNHIQVCIRNLDCVKGFFKPRVL